ncbi:hypothetical protein [Fangia hongkongensis]|uniref:hypothetical protein n=1 Tax=Fangia hongkongensis TaxID=270495 RepID=UPI0003639CDE|nr:hypothetical protein [Fangia hongkongensis]MBK2123799.1 hypothetical protein [Fangia hongkongensis]
MSVIKDWDFFWQNRAAFKLGHIPTEMPHPDSTGLSEQAKTNLPSAISTLIDIDNKALDKLTQYDDEYNQLSETIEAVLAKKGRIFISGCGATGRLAMMLEKLWRAHAPSFQRDNVIGFMAGGDAALIKSIEGFEDHPEYAKRHMMDLGFGEDDLMIGVTEGGETPFVLSTIEEACNISKHKPWLIYCNPDKALKDIVRSDKLIQRDDVVSVSLEIGNMAVSGSTRMQATTVQSLFVGLALMSQFSLCDFISEINTLKKRLNNIDINALQSLISFESNCYQQGGFVTYVSNSHIGLTVLTDTTERAPTFSLNGFENNLNTDDEPSLSYLSLEGYVDTSNAWHDILGHAPRTLEWSDTLEQTGAKRLHGFDISQGTLKRREKYPLHQVIDIFEEASGYIIYFADHKFDINFQGLSVLSQQILLKMVLNIHSTLIMGILGRYHSNIMTYVRPANNKLIDRAIRYVIYLLEEKGVKDLEYDEIALRLYKVSASLDETESVVLATYQSILNDYEIELER